MVPNPQNSCGPYTPATHRDENQQRRGKDIHSENHDTIGMLVIDNEGHIASGTSTNGLRHKIPG